MKKVIFCFLISVVFQQCTDELHEIDSVISVQENSVSEGDLIIDNKDIPLNSFSAFYYYLENHKPFVDNQIEHKIIHRFNKDDSADNDLSAHWIGDFNFESGKYELDIISDKGIKVFIDDKVVFEDWNNSGNNHFRINLTLQGIRRLKVFYNMNSNQKLAKIIEYYTNLHKELDEEESNVPTYNSLISGDRVNQTVTHESRVSVNWKLLK